MSNLIFIGNIEDQVNGGMIQVTLEDHSNEHGTEYTVRNHGTIVPPTHEFHNRVLAMYLAWQDAWAGTTDLDTAMYDLNYPDSIMLKEQA